MRGFNQPATRKSSPAIGTHLEGQSSVVSMQPTSAGIVVIRKSPEGWLFLLLRAYRNWDFPKGRPENGETPLQTAIRETEEETTLKDLQFLWGRHFIETTPYSGKKIARYYLAEAPSNAKVDLPVTAELGRPEHNEYRWVRFQDAQKLLPERLQPVINWANRLIST